MHDTIYWLAVLVTVIAAVYVLTLVWLDTPTKGQRDDEAARDRHPSGWSR